MYLKLNISTLVIVAITILIADFFWLGYIANSMYENLRIILNPGVSKSNLPYRILPAIFAYGCMVLSLSVLSVPNVIRNKGIYERIISSVIWGGMWGLGVYGTYDMTNLAVIKSFPLDTAVVDMIWGIILGGIGSFVGSYTI
jgi:uncharacterized membrane protein